MEHLSGGDILIRALRDANVKYIWGYPGGAALHIYDAIYRQEDVVHLLVRHEQAAVHAADGFSSCLLYTSPSPRDVEESRMPSSA